ncbi:MAG: hypothetical protein WKF59_25485 [Chitinophagaceae bacterium]
MDYKFLYAVNHGTGKRNTNAAGYIDGIQGISGTGFAAISNATLTSQTFTHTLNYIYTINTKYQVGCISRI